MNSNKKMKLGRGHDCDILLSDISVSRIHCFLLADSMNKNLFIIDNDSKFGTLALVQSPFIKIEELLPLNIQIGRTYVQCIVKKPFKFFDCCNVEEFSNIFYYFEQNEKKVNEHINLIVKSDEDDDIMNDSKLDKENNTCEQKYPVKVNGDFTYVKFETIDVNKDKISDNEFLRMRHKEENKNHFGENLIEDDNNNNEGNKNIENEYDSIKVGEENDNEGNNEENKENNEDNDEENNDNNEEEEVNENDATIQ